MAFFSRRANNAGAILLTTPSIVPLEFVARRTLMPGPILFLFQGRISNAAAGPRSPQFVFRINGVSQAGPVGRITLAAGGEESCNLILFSEVADLGPSTFDISFTPDTDNTQTLVQFRNICTYLQLPDWDNSFDT